MTPILQNVAAFLPYAIRVFREGTYGGTLIVSYDKRKLLSD